MIHDVWPQANTANNIPLHVKIRAACISLGLLSLDFLSAANGANKSRCVSIASDKSNIYNTTASGFIHMQGNRNLPSKLSFVATVGFTALFEFLSVVL